MSRYVKLTCPSCGNDWQEDLDEHQTISTLYRNLEPDTRTEEYNIQCPNCGANVVAEVEIKE